MTPLNLSNFFIDSHELSATVFRSPKTLNRWLRKDSNSLPPYIQLGRKRLFFRQLAFEWMASHEHEGSPKTCHLNIDGLPRTMNTASIAALFHLSIATIHTLRSRPLESTPLPPSVRPDLWDTRSVFEWALAQVKGIKRDQIQLEELQVRKIGTADLLLHGPRLRSHSLSSSGRGR